MKNLTVMYDVLVVGGGAAGMMAAIAAAERGKTVCIAERNGFLGKKLNITGKGRCNLTNNCDVDTVIKNAPRNGRFLYSALNAFPPSEVIIFFESRGLPLKTERGNRVFPESDKATDVSTLLRGELKRLGVKTLQSRVAGLCITNGKLVGVKSETGKIDCKACILATGGLSYSATGSTGDGYKLADAAGHAIVSPVASIVPLCSENEFCKRLSGLALKNVRVKAFTSKNKIVFEDFGELLFTHFGISGPVPLSMSAHLRNFEKESYYALIDLKPALDEKTLDVRILRDFEAAKNKALSNGVSGLMPSAMIPFVLEQANLDGAKSVNSITKAERLALVEALKRFRIGISGARPVEEAVITSGGIATREIDPATMMSKLVKGLYFAGEVIDVDAYTGGFNLQIAWATGRLAGMNA